MHQKAAESTRAYGWKEGIERVLGTCSVQESRELRMKLRGRHTGWIGFLDPFRRDEVLVVDPGWGTAAIVLSRFYKRVFLCPEDEAVAACQKNRIEWLGIQNIEWLEKQLPIGMADHSCDAAVLYLCSDSRCLDDRFLQEIRRVLRESGSCIIGFENRYDHNYLRARMTGRRLRDRSHYPSRQAVRKKLRRNFRTSRFYPLQPGLYDLQSILPPAGRDPLWEPSFSSVKSRVNEKLRHYIGSAYAVVSSNGTRVNSLVETVLVEVASRLGRKRPLTLRRLCVGKPNGLLLFVGEAGRAQEHLIRIPLDSFTLSSYRRQRELLERLLQMGPLGKETPQPVLSGEVAGFPFLVERLIPGATPQKPSREITRQAASFLAGFHQRTAAGTVIEEAHLKRWVHRPFALAVPWIEMESRDDLVKVEEEIATSLRGQSIPLVWAHGDFTFDNLLFHQKSGRVTGIIDWDFSEKPALPLIDLLYFLHYDEMERRKRSLAEVVCQRFSPVGYNSFERQLIDAYCRQVGLSSRFLRIFTILSWVYHLAYRFESSESYLFPDLIEWGCSNVLKENKERNGTALLKAHSVCNIQQVLAGRPGLS